MCSRSALIVELAKQQLLNSEKINDCQISSNLNDRDDDKSEKEELPNISTENEILFEGGNIDDQMVDPEQIDIQNLNFIYLENLSENIILEGNVIDVKEETEFNSIESFDTFKPTNSVVHQETEKCTSETEENVRSNNEGFVPKEQPLKKIEDFEYTNSLNLTTSENMQVVEEPKKEHTVQICVLQNIIIPEEENEYFDEDPIYSPDYTQDHDSETSDSSSSLGGAINNNLKEGRPRKGRKRKYDSQNRYIRKTLKNSNKPHVTARGKHIITKEFTDYKCKCSNVCHEKINTEDRQEEFKKFWELGDCTSQNAYVTSCVKEGPIKRKYVTKDESSRQFSRQYYMKKVRVCRSMFVETFRLSTKRINTALVKLRSSSFIDKRGKHDNHKKMTTETYDSIVNQINRLPKYKSHYCRESTSGDRRYLSSELNLRKIYELYKLDNPHLKVSLSQYKRIFYHKFNLYFKPLKTDTCNFCDNINARLKNEGHEEKILELRQLLEEHQSLASIARSKMKTDIEEAKQNKNIETLTFNLEKTLPLPRLNTNIIFYKSQLWVYNLGIHASKENKGNCMVWVEGEAGRGAQEVGSCLKKYIETEVGSEIHDLRLWSDSCGGQNRNIKLVLMLRDVLRIHPSLKNITLSFLVSGHSFLPNDADFSDIEKALKYQQRIYTPDEYMSVMRSCRKNKLRTHRMHQDEFFGTTSLEKNITNRKVDITGKKINWLKMKQIKLQKNEPMTLYVKETYEEGVPYDKVDISKKTKRRSGPCTENELVSLCPEGKPISEAKLEDLKSIYHLIPSDVFFFFYKKLRADSTIKEDVEGFNGSLDFEIDNAINV